MADKTTPKHPSYNCQRGMLCPTCDKALWVRVEIKGVFGTKKITVKEQPNFCKYCGQSLLPAYAENERRMIMANENLLNMAEQKFQSAAEKIAKDLIA